MEKMSYKGWVWPQNPERYEQSYLREPVHIKNSSDEWIFYGLGPLKRTVKGEGVFCGSSAFADFKALAAMLSSVESGDLVHPVWGSMRAYFMELEMTQEPRENEISYRFTFREANGRDEIPK